MKLPPSLTGGFQEIVTLSSRILSTTRNLGGSGTSFLFFLKENIIN